MTPREFYLLHDIKTVERRAIKEAYQSGGKKKLAKKSIDRLKKLMDDRQAQLDLENAKALEAKQNG